MDIEVDRKDFKRSMHPSTLINLCKATIDRFVSRNGTIIYRGLGQFIIEPGNICLVDNAGSALAIAALSSINPFDCGSTSSLIMKKLDLKQDEFDSFNYAFDLYSQAYYSTPSNIQFSKAGQRVRDWALSNHPKATHHRRWSNRPHL